MKINSVLNIFGMAAMACVLSCNSMKEVAVQSIAVDPAEKTVPVGESVQLNVVFTPENATNQRVVWTTDDEAVATVDENGVVTAVAMGETMISALASGFRAQCRVTVPDNTVYVESVSLDETALTMEIGDRQTLVATVTPADATDPSVKWSSDNTAVATVSEETGEITAVAGGTANITATAVLAKGTVSASCAVTVVASEYNVLFETFGGTEIQMAVVERDGKLPRPEDPERMIDVPEGLYQGQVDPNDETRLYTFGGWYTDAELQNEYDFDSPVNSSFTLYAKWEGETPQPMELSSDKDLFTAALTYLNSADNVSVPTEFTLVLADDITDPEWSDDFDNGNVTLTFVGKAQERVISRTRMGTLTYIYNATFILGKNIKLTSENLGVDALIDINNEGTLIMLDGSKISDIKGATGLATAVNVHAGSSTFRMKGGEICNNESRPSFASSKKAAIVFLVWGPMYMEGGLIAGNTVTATEAATDVGGAIATNSNVNFFKTGGEIRDNKVLGTTSASCKVGQQILCNRGSYFKVDENLGPDDNLTTEETATNPLWIPIR